MKQRIIYWLVALIMVLATGITVWQVRKINYQNKTKVQMNAKNQAKLSKEEKQLAKKNREELRKPIDFKKSSLTGSYPNIKQEKYQNSKKHQWRLWIEVSPKDQRVYVKSGKTVLYTMYASIAKNYPKRQKYYQQTPFGQYKIQAKRGDYFYDATKGFGARYWTSFDGLHNFESVPIDKKGNFIEIQAKKLGKPVTKKHNISAYGSVWLSEADAKWIKENIKKNTIVVIHSNNTNQDALDGLEFE